MYTPSGTGSPAEVPFQPTLMSEVTKISWPQRLKMRNVLSAAPEGASMVKVSLMPSPSGVNTLGTNSPNASLKVTSTVTLSAQPAVLLAVSRIR